MYRSPYFLIPKPKTFCRGILEKEDEVHENCSLVKLIGSWVLGFWGIRVSGTPFHLESLWFLELELAAVKKLTSDQKGLVIISGLATTSTNFRYLGFGVLSRLFWRLRGISFTSLQSMGNNAVHRCPACTRSRLRKNPGPCENQSTNGGFATDEGHEAGETEPHRTLSVCDDEATSQSTCTAATCGRSQRCRSGSEVEVDQNSRPNFATRSELLWAKRRFESVS